MRKSARKRSARHRGRADSQARTAEPQPRAPNQERPSLAGEAAGAVASVALRRLRDKLQPAREDADRPKVSPLQEGAPRGRPDPRDSQQRAREPGRGRTATTPSEIPKRGWKDILLRVKDSLAEDNLSLVAAGVAFYALLAIFPGIAALVSIYGLVADPATVNAHVTALAGVVPAEALGIIEEQLKAVASKPEGTLTFGAIAGLAVALWSATGGVKAIFAALNIAYDEEERRGFLRLNLIAIVFTLGAILFVLFALGLIAVLPAALDFLGLGSATEWILSVARWPILALGILVALALLYRYGPSRDTPQWRWLSWGAIGAGVLWIVGSLLFSFYVANFGNYNATYGSVGAIIALLMWFYISAYIVLVGAELNAEMEHQTAYDTTEGPPQPMGARRAHVADTLGAAKG